jgi:drug/metabolite transporter (DMT)-like permease
MSLIAYVTPAIALTLGPIVRGEPMTPSTIAGAACILAGVVLVVRGRH